MMLNCELKVEYEGRVIDVPTGSNLSDFLKSEENDQLYCAKFLEPIIVNDEPLSIVHFTDLLFLASSIIFFAKEYPFKIQLRSQSSLNLKIIKPVAVPQIHALNREIKSSKDFIFARIFFKPHTKNSKDDLEYLDTACSKWGDFQESLKNILIKANKKLYGLSIGIMENQNILPELEPSSKFADENNASKIMIIIIMTFCLGEKFVSLENVPRIPKDIILRMQEGKSTFNVVERRIIKACLNGGVPVHLLDSPMARIEMSRTHQFESKDFDQVELFLGDHEKIAGHLLEKLQSFVEDLKDHLFTTSSEAALRFIFWDPVINRMLQHGLEGKQKNYILEPEWETKSIFSGHTNQKIDHAVTFGLGGKSYPILFVEVGKEPFDSANPHKDQSKLLGIVSQACIDLAYGLVSQKKKPEDSRTCGVWIGGLRMQFLVAQAIVSNLPDGRCEIHANISINPHWLFDLSLSQPKEISNCANVCCKSSINVDSMLYERIKKGNLNIERYRFYSHDASRDLKEKDLKRPTSTAVTQQTFSVSAAKTKLVSHEIDFNVLKALNFFLQYVKSRIDFILSDKCNAENENRVFKDKGEMGIFVESRNSSKSETPQKRQITSASASKAFGSPLTKKSKKHDNLDLFVIQKSFTKEIEIILKLSMFPDSFPVLFDYEIISSDQETIIQYEFEKLKMIFDPESNFISPLILRDEPLDTLFGCLNFTIECLYGLYLLHEVFGLIHSDISINNIMFSDLTCTWKIIDFDQCLEVSESIRTPRVAGTHEFIAPEARESRIFTKESDIFSLGRVFVTLFDFLILRDICLSEDEDQVSEKTRNIASNFRFVINGMIHSNPSERPSTLKALDDLFILFESFSFLNEIPLYSSIRMLLRNNHHNPIIQEKLENIRCYKADVKKPKISEEKEQPFSSFQTVE